MAFILNKEEQDLSVTHKQRGQGTLFHSTSAELPQNSLYSSFIRTDKNCYSLPSLIKKNVINMSSFELHWTEDCWKAYFLHHALQPAVLLFYRMALHWLQQAY